MDRCPIPTLFSPVVNTHSSHVVERSFDNRNCRCDEKKIEEGKNPALTNINASEASRAEMASINGGFFYFLFSLTLFSDI